MTSTSDNVDLIASAGPIITPAGVLTANLITGNTLTIDGELSPGDAVGQLPVAADVQFSTGDILDIQINGLTPGTQHDQLLVTGTVDLDDATLVLSGTHTPAVGEQFILIDNDGTTDAVIGTFVGLNEGAVISNSSNAAVTSGTATASANITDNDTAIFTIDDVSVNEADGTATFTVSVDNPLDTDVMLDVSYAAGTAVAADFDGATETVTFAAGSTTVQTVTVAIISFWT